MVQELMERGDLFRALAMDTVPRQFGWYKRCECALPCEGCSCGCPLAFCS